MRVSMEKILIFNYILQVYNHDKNQLNCCCVREAISILFSIYKIIYLFTKKGVPSVQN